MKTKMKIVFVALLCSLQINAQTKQEVFSSIQKLVDKATGQKIQSDNVFAKKDVRDKLGKQVFTENEVTVNKIPEGKSKYEWISRASEIMWDEFLDYLIFTEFKNSNLQIVELRFKKELKKELFTSEDMGSTSGNKFYSSFKFYILTVDKNELEKLLKRLYELKEKKLASPFNKEIEKFNRQQTITWLKDKLSKTIVGDEYTTSLKLISFDDCNLVYEYTNFVGRKYQETMPTSITSIDKYNRFSYGKKSCISKSFAFGIIQKEDEITYKENSFLRINSKDEDLISNIEFALKHLANFCNGSLTNQSSKIDTKENLSAATQEIGKEQKEYYENGKLKYVGKYTNGIGNGEWKTYHENGQLKQIINLIDGKGNGECKNYHENGQLSQIGRFIDNVSTGEWKFYNDKGELMAKKLYDVNGKETADERMEYYNNGKLKQIANFANGKQNGVDKAYYESGQLRSVGNFTNGKGSGGWKFYHENGRLESNRNYIDGKLNGEVKMYSQNGDLQQVRNYKDDIGNGECKFYSKTGKLGSVGNYTNGKQNGEWKEYNDNGELVGRKFYDAEGNEVQIKEVEAGFDILEEIGYYLENKIRTDLRKGSDFLEKKDYKNAIIEFDAYIKSNPRKTGGASDGAEYFYRGKARYYVGNYKGSVEDFNVFLSEFNKSNSKLAEGFYYRGLSKIILKQMDAGCLDLYKAKDGFPDAKKEIEKYCK